MSFPRLILAALVAAAALAAVGCGGADDSVPTGSIAVVDGTEITKQQLDELVSQAKKGYEARKQEFPKAGSPEYQSIQTQYVAYLVQLEELRRSADEFGLEVTQKDLDKAEAGLIKDSFKGEREEYEKALEAQGYTREAFLKTLESSLLQQKLFAEVTKDVKVTDKDLLDYYTANQSQYGTPESRDVRHILISEKNGSEVDFAESKAKADQIYAQLSNGGNFAALAKANSDDPGSKDSGGKLTISRGQTVPEFDKVSFELDKGEISKPVKTTYGYHVIEATSDVRPAKTTSLDEVKDSIRTTLLQQKKNEEMSAWVEDLQKEYDGKVSYAEGYQPPEIPEVPEAPTETQ